MNSFKALVVDKSGDEEVSVNVKELQQDDLPAGDVLIKVHYSSVNFKDGLAATKNGNIVSSYPMVPGIDLAGVVESSDSSSFSKGDKVIVTSYDLGVDHFGGYSEYARVPSEWVVPLPQGLSLKEAMIFGTAGFTAGLSVIRLQEEGVTPEDGPVLVSGATGGVGSMAVAMLAKLGYEVVASTGKESEHNYLKELGASEIVSREDSTLKKSGPLINKDGQEPSTCWRGDIVLYSKHRKVWWGSRGKWTDWRHKGTDECVSFHFARRKSSWNRFGPLSNGTSSERMGTSGR